MTASLIEEMEGRKVLIGRWKKERFLLPLKVIPVFETIMKGVGKGIIKAAGTRTPVKRGNSSLLQWAAGKIEETEFSGKVKEICGQRGGIITARSLSKLGRSGVRRP